MKSEPLTADSRRDPVLDLIRAVAAFLVVIHHARNLYFVDYHPGLSLFSKGFYFLTNFGPVAVLVFFVLSGYFVGGSVLRKMQTARWSWGTYALDRLTRLWIVLLPALLLTALFDSLGMHFFNNAFYAGNEGNMLIQSPVQDALTGSTFVCNMLFLQTLSCPTFGSDGPLWSLANEFWYYVWFPALLAIFFIRSRVVVYIVGFLAVLTMYRFSQLLPGFALWLLGVVAYAMRDVKNARLLLWFRRLEWPALALFLVILLASRMHWTNDTVVGVAFFLYFLCLIQKKKARLSPRMAKLAVLMSEQSFSLYVIHMPFILLIISLTRGMRSQPSIGTYLGYGGVVILTYALAFLSYYLFESRTSTLRQAIASALGKQQRLQ